MNESRQTFSALDLTRVEEKLDLLLAAIPHREYITVQDIARMHGWSISYINRHPWTMPNYGISDYPGHERRWLKETAQQWYRVPPVNRQRDWDRTSFSKRQQLTA